MCQLCSDPSHQNPNLHLLAKRSPAVDGVISSLLDRLITVLKRWHDRLLEALRNRQIDPKNPGSIRPRVQRTFDPDHQALAETIRQMWFEGAQAGREETIRRHSLDVPVDITRRSVRRELRENAQIASSYTSSRMVDDVAESIADAGQEGYNVDEITEALSDQVLGDMRGYEARRITETETYAGTSRGSLSAYEMSPDVNQKRWIAIDDTRTRATHRAADSQTVPIGSKFEVGGEAAMYPGDPRLSPGERINCRCWIIGVMA